LSARRPPSRSRLFPYTTLFRSSPSQRAMDYFYKNAEGDEVLFVHDGSGVLLSQFGKLPIKKGDYVVIPRTVIYKLQFDEGPLRLDRKSTRLNSSHVKISYAVFC